MVNLNCNVDLSFEKQFLANLAILLVALCLNKIKMKIFLLDCVTFYLYYLLFKNNKLFLPGEDSKLVS